jgi:fused signal recognition particle receptor
VNGDSNIIYFFGNNGVGKTTSIVNFALQLKKLYQDVVIIAADEFRGGAVEQLVQMCQEKNIQCYSAKEYQNEPSVFQIIFDGININLKKKTKVILVDTAGRSHNDVNLMDNLKKQYDIAEKVSKSLKTESTEKIEIKSVWVNDGNIVNAFQSQKAFMGKIPLDYIIITKIKHSSSYYNLINMMNHLEKPIIYYSPSRHELVQFTPTEFLENLS